MVSPSATEASSLLAQNIIATTEIPHQTDLTKSNHKKYTLQQNRQQLRWYNSHFPIVRQRVIQTRLQNATIAQRNPRWRWVLDHWELGGITPESKMVHDEQKGKKLEAALDNVLDILENEKAEGLGLFGLQHLPLSGDVLRVLMYADELGKFPERQFEKNKEQSKGGIKKKGE